MTQYNPKIEKFIEDLSSDYKLFIDKRPSTSDILGKRSISENQRGLVESAKVILDSGETIKQKYQQDSQSYDVPKDLLGDLDILMEQVRENTQPVSYSGLHNLLKSGSPLSNNPNHNPFEDLLHKARYYK